ncbi:uncharacterized protein M421DRAFT_98964 [Didymella exigua CBS 183.55]|uniref:Uncharacterized protein n=1 Tax=Didymella exigua CBS 183.55 TaxID=1150837 RepID=A0A6A5RU18_9PLEO|nr:uncharacterized protein M421DRAFT_98964 [Didymella exigua CBS 183.55]KAF1931931.1 hypothetical protein M421DRAFT_98964 [Didymella exigua CBS 183.55]
MKTSKFAPRTPLEQLKQSKAEKLKNDKDKATRLMGRLRWKAELLMVSYFKAMEILQSFEQHNGHDESHRGLARQAESMFKIDFFEFYTFLERFITICLAAVGVSVSGSVPLENFNALRYITNPDLHRTRPQASHAFHANLLEALDDEKCPLHSSLGTQDARIQLGLAKDYRNAWKDADEQDGTTNGYTDNGVATKNVKLASFELGAMLRTLIIGCQHANDVVQAYGGAIVDVSSLSSIDFEPATHAHDAIVMSNVPYEYMDDAMELD